MDYNLQKNQKAEQTYIALFQFETHCVLKLSWSHYRVLMRINDEQERRFYMEECAKAA